MKSEERHQLHTNDLEALANRAAPFFEQYGTQLVGGLCAVLILGAGIIWWNRSSSAENAAGWDAVSAHLTEDYVAGAAAAESYAAVADRYPGGAVAAWARTKEGEKHLNSGLRLAFTDRESAISDLKQARRAYSDVLQNPQATTAIRETASYGLAVTLESLAGMPLDEGETVTAEQAAEAYQKLLGEFPESVYQPVASRRIEVLRSGGGKEFYAWFGSQTPKPTDRPVPGDMGGGLPGGMPSGHPDIDSMPLPEIPADLQLPGGADAAGEGAGTGPALSVPGDNPAAPFPSPGATGDDAPQKPKADKPDASSDSPAEEKPAPADPEKPSPATESKPEADEKKPASE